MAQRNGAPRHGFGSAARTMGALVPVGVADTSLSQDPRGVFAGLESLGGNVIPPLEWYYALAGHAVLLWADQVRRMGFYLGWPMERK